MNVVICDVHVLSDAAKSLIHSLCIQGLGVLRCERDFGGQIKAYTMSRQIVALPPFA